MFTEELRANFSGILNAVTELNKLVTAILNTSKA